MRLRHFRRVHGLARFLGYARFLRLMRFLRDLTPLVPLALAIVTAPASWATAATTWKRPHAFAKGAEPC